MLIDLCGSKSVEQVLLFLFVNERGYGTQLQRCLDLSLTPIQKALQRLERAGIVSSYHEGKTRLYQLNAAYLLFAELEALLKKSYLLLSSSEKKRYHFPRHEESATYREAIDQQVEERSALQKMWEHLGKVKQLTFQAKSRAQGATLEVGKGKGEVIVATESKHVLLFQERGSWKKENGPEMDFSNVFRWMLDEKAHLISLEHLRYGADRPVFLFHLAPVASHSLESTDPHLCGEDTYFGRLTPQRHFLQLYWRFIGPKKNEEITYRYTF